jgi:hypothetical protein
MFENRKGRETWQIILMIVAVFVILFVALGATGKFKTFNLFFKSIGYNNSIPLEDITYIGFNLIDDKLVYYTGSEWKEIKLGKGEFKFGETSFKPEEIKERFEDFYFKTPRKPERLNLSINDWRYWEARFSDNGIWLKFYTKKGFIGNNLEESYIFDYLNNEFRSPSATELSNYEKYFPKFSKFEIEEPSIKTNLIAWRDSILQDNRCEKFFELSLKENGKEESKRYTVKKIDNYLVIDLNNPVLEGIKQEWDDEGCFRIENYVDGKEEIIQVPLNIHLIHKNAGNAYFTYDFEEKRWELPDLSFKSKKVYDINQFESFNYGLRKIFEIGAGDIYTFEAFLGTPADSEEFYKKPEISKEDLEKNFDKILYEILDGYNKKILEKLENE